MKRFCLLIFGLMLSLTGYSQPFVDNPDYIYGVGISEIESIADSTAMLSLSRSIYTDVTDETEHYLEEMNGEVSERFVKNISLKTSLKIKGAKKLVTKSDGKYTVYYYINKKEYIDERLRIYGTCLANIDIYETSKDPHAINYIFGSLYTAYVAMDDALLNALYKESVSYRDYALSELNRRYKNAFAPLSIRKMDARNFYEVREENGKSLPGFEYEDVSGKWVSPSKFKNDDRVECKGNPSEYKWAVVNMRSRDSKYRLTFEKEVAGRSVKISVPEEFYQDKYRDFISTGLNE